MAKKRITRSTGFSLNRFYKELDIAKTEQDAVADCLTLGVAHYYHHIYGYDKYGPAPSYLISERMHEPYIFGFGMVEVIRHKTLSLETRLKIAQYTLQQIDVVAEYGTPHGLPTLLSFLAGAGRLEPALFRTVMITVDFGGSLFDDWLLDEVRCLLDWLINRADIPEPERTWWLWHIGLRGESPQMCKALAEGLLTHANLPASSKRALCEAWLTDTPAGEPAAQWEAMQDLVQGDVEGFVAHAAEAGLPLPEKMPSRADLEAGYDSALDTLLDDEDEVGDAPPVSLHLLRNMLIGPMGLLPLTPTMLKRAAIAALPRLGDDPLAVCQKYLGSNRDYYADPVNQGVADVIRAHHAQMPEAEVRGLIERGLKIGSVPVRKTYYQLGADLLGEDFMAQAAGDNAKSIREWAAKKARGEMKRGRKPKTGKKAPSRQE